MTKVLKIDEFINIVKNGSYDIQSNDSSDIYFEIKGASVSYDKSLYELTFYLVNGGASFSISTELIDKITETNGVFSIKFSSNMPDLGITKIND